MKSNLTLIFICILLALTASAQNKKPTIVIVHGAWGGGWAFKKVDSMLTSRGADVYRPTLTGQGERAHLASKNIGLSTHIEDIVNTILYEDLKDIVLVGHSYGGMVITGVADIIPERIRKIVYLDAFLPNNGESVASLRGGSAEEMEKANPGGFLVPAWVKATQAAPKDVPHSVKTFTDKIVLKNPAAAKINALYILTVHKGKEAKDDSFGSQAERARKRGWKVLNLTADHNAHWSAPVELSDML